RQRNDLRFALKVLDLPSVGVLFGIKLMGLPLYAARHPVVAVAFIRAVGRLMRELPEVWQLRRYITQSAIYSSRDLIRRFTSQETNELTHSFSRKQIPYTT